MTIETGDSGDVSYSNIESPDFVHVEVCELSNTDSIPAPVGGPGEADNDDTLLPGYVDHANTGVQLEVSGGGHSEQFVPPLEITKRRSSFLKNNIFWTTSHLLIGLLNLVSTISWVAYHFRSPEGSEERCREHW